MKRNPFKKNQLSAEYQRLISQINILEDTLKPLNNSELRAKFFHLKKRYQENQSLDGLITESFELTREASRRALGMRQFDVQLVGGLVLNNQKIAEMKTGEGKTLVATLPACLNALTGEGVQIVTVNDYLANRDQVAMGQIYGSLGLTTGLIQDQLSRVERRENYAADITYVTNYELVFDFLRDNMVLKLDDVVLRSLNYCIIDEVDSILIDEAQTPLIISNNVETPVDRYLVASEIISYLESKIHYTVDEKNKIVILTEEGSRQIENILLTKDLYNPQDPWIPYIINAIKAKALFSPNVDYIVQNNRIIIVDEFTGRVMPDRRWGDGLHQAIEAKEKLPIRQKTETVAAITYQNFFLLYPKLSGMTGTGKTAEIEFEKIYRLAVDEIPTARPSKRKDLPDIIYKDQFSKWNAIAQACYKITNTDQPILIGTTSIEKSEMLAQLLSEYKLSYQLLNARPENIRKESEIVAQAGKKKMITIATNMAGRGTDIILGGNVSFESQKMLYTTLVQVKRYILLTPRHILQSHVKQNLKSYSQSFLSVLFSLLQDQQFLALSDIEVLKILKENEQISVVALPYKCSIRFLMMELRNYQKKQQTQENQIVKNLGGLYIVGTERNYSRRVDDQLRGRCGRQGDPGISRFFLSLDDNLLRLFGGSNIQTFMQTQINDDSPLEAKILTKSLNFAQGQVEERAYQQRKNLLDYDEALNKQRNIVYYERKQILKTISTTPTIFTYGEQIILDILEVLKDQAISEARLIKDIERTFGKKLVLKYINTSNTLLDSLTRYEIKLYLFDEFWSTYRAKILQFELYGSETGESFQRTIILINIDRIWREHLQKLNFLREAVGWRGYGQNNPLYEYKKEAFSAFRTCSKNLRQLVIYDLLRATIL